MSFTREIIKKTSSYLCAKGFSCSGRHFYKIANDLAFCVSIEMPSGLVYVTAYVVPLYVPCSYRYYTYGNRLNYIADIQLPILSKTDDLSKIDQWCNLLCQNLDQKIVPFFTQIDSPCKLLNYLDKSQNSSTSYIFCPIADIWRLKMFTYFYVDEYEMLRHAAKQYCKEVKKMPFTESVMQERMTEVEEVLYILDCEETATAYRLSTIENTINVLK